MKKRIILLGILSIISLGIIAGYNYLNHKDDVNYNLKQSDIAIMVYDHETESYVKQSTVPKGAKYSLNEELTKCESGGKVTDYSKANGTLKYEVDVADQCYVYFDVDNTPSYAIYSETDNSLVFYKNYDKAKVGETYNGKVTTAIYTGFETDEYTFNVETVSADTPWNEYAELIKLVSIANEITPLSTSGWFSNFKNIESIELTNLDTSQVTNMAHMFIYAGYASDNFILNLGETFDTSKVTDMTRMFYSLGYKDKNFTLNLGSEFDTSSVTNMYNMFSGAGFNSTIFVLDLGNEFDTSNVTNMRNMFRDMGYRSTNFTLNLGDKFNTSNVINMGGMFFCIGANNSNLQLNLGDKFDTSKVEDMSQMFRGVGRNATNFTLNLGNKFDTSKVTNMNYMFDDTGRFAADFELDVSGFTILSTCDLTNFASNSVSKIIFGEGWANATLGSQMFYKDTSTPLEIVNAPANILNYDFASDNRIVTFTTI